MKYFSLPIRLTVLLASLFMKQMLIGQGCSDAGFCTMGAMKPDQAYSKKIDFKLRSFELNYYHGKTLLSPVVTMVNAEMNFGINDYNAVQVKVPYHTVTGDLGTTQGVGDLSLSFTRSLRHNNGYNLGLSLGAKIPTGKSDLESDRGTGDLPMYYQVSLGTYDLIAGASLINEKWLFATGIQAPVIHQNENDFRWFRWKQEGTWAEDSSYVFKYNLSNQLKRGTDIMFRAERNVRLINYNFGIGLLAIYRISKDERLDFTINERVRMDHTTGLVLNLLANFGYNININNSLKLIMGLKLKDREKNPDGLTRKHVISASYVYRF